MIILSGKSGSRSFCLGFKYCRSSNTDDQLTVPHNSDVLVLVRGSCDNTVETKKTTLGRSIPIQTSIHKDVFHRQTYNTFILEDQNDT